MNHCYLGIENIKKKPGKKSGNISKIGMNRRNKQLQFS